MSHRFAVELRATVVAGNRVAGHAAVYGQYAALPGHMETIAPGAFDRALRDRHDVLLTVGHDPDRVLARTKAGTLTLAGDDIGLRFEATLPETTLAADVRVLLERGDLDSMSFAFIPTDDDWSRVEGRSLRTITDLDLYDVAIVGRPAYEGTDVRLRSFAACCTDMPAPARRPRLTRARARQLLGEIR